MDICQIKVIFCCNFISAFSHTVIPHYNILNSNAMPGNPGFSTDDSWGSINMFVN